MTDDPAGGKFPGRGSNHRLNRPTGEPQPDPRLDGLGPNRAMVLAPGQHGPNAPQQPDPDETTRAELPDDTPDPHFTPNSNSHPQTPVSQPGHVHVDGTPTHHVGQNLPDASQAMPGPAMTPVFFRRSVDGTPANHVAQHGPDVQEPGPRPDDTPHRTPLDEGLAWVKEGGEEKLKWLGDPKDAPFLDNGPYEVHLNASGELEQSYNPADRDDASNATYYEPSSADDRDLHIGGHPDESGFMAMPDGELRWVGPRGDVPLTPDGHVSLGDKGEVVVDPPPEVFRADYREREPFAGERSEFGDRSGGQGDALPSAEPAGYREREPFVGDERSDFHDRSGGQGDALPSAEPTTMVKPVHSVQPGDGTSGSSEESGLAWVNGDGTWKLKWVGDPKDAPLLDNGPYEARIGKDGDVHTLYNGHDEGDPTKVFASGKPGSGNPDDGTAGLIVMPNGDLRWVGPRDKAPLLDDGKVALGKDGKIEFDGPKCAPDGTSRTEGTQQPLVIQDPNSDGPPPGFHGLPTYGSLPGEGRQGVKPHTPREERTGDGGGSGGSSGGQGSHGRGGSGGREGDGKGDGGGSGSGSSGEPRAAHMAPTTLAKPVGKESDGKGGAGGREGDGGGSGGSAGGQGDGPLTRGVRAPMPIAKEADGKGGGGGSGGSAGGQGDGPLTRGVAVEAPMAKVGDGKGSGGGSGGSAGGQGDGLLQPRTLYKPVAKESDGKGGSGGQEGNGGGSGGSAGGQGDGPLTRGVKVQAPMAKVGDGKGSGGGSGGSAGGQGAVPGEPVTSIKPVAKVGDGKGGEGKGGDGKEGDGKGGDGKDGKGGDGKEGDGKGGDGKDGKGGDGKEGDGKGGDGKDGKGGDGKEGDGKGGDGKDGKGGDGKEGDGKGGDGKDGKGGDGKDGKGGDGKDGKPKPLPAVKSADGKGNLRFNKDDWLKLLGALHDVENGLIDYATFSRYGELNGTFTAQPRDTQWGPAKDLNARASKFGGSVETVNEALRQRLSTVVNAMRWAIEVFENTDDLANYSLNDFVTEFPDLNSGGGKMSGGQGSGGA
ncbi:hypothetical protein [Saccharopolyspora elongata]|uniref:hypothetical protein n=1 Tax=Saccharopolyspora elongata TaxID=2530387 RepID=UPI00140549D4|nr:hypothetical protein [Saccharopolyspora elongata]